MMATRMKRLKAAIVSWILRITPATRRDWAQAMVSEINHIDDDYASLQYAVGCYVVVTMEYLKMNRYMPLLRFALIIGLLGWVGAKLFLFTMLVGGSMNAPQWFIGATVLSAIAYMSAAGAIAANRIVLSGATLFGALLVNWLQFSLVALTPPVQLTFYYAIVAEECFMWIGFLLVVAILFYSRRAEAHRLRA